MRASTERQAEMADLVARAESLRASIARVNLELKNASAEERAISERLVELATERAAPVPPPSARPRVVADAPEASPAKGEQTSTVITARTLERWRRRALGVAVGSAALTTLSVVVLLLLFPNEPSRARPAAVPPASAAPSIAPVAVRSAPRPAAVATVVTPAAKPAPTGSAPTPAASPRQSREDSEARGARETGQAAQPLREDDILELAPRSTAAPASTATGSLTVMCLPVTCDQIRIDGVLVGSGHLFNHVTSAGIHTLTARGHNGVARTLRIEVSPDQPRELRLAMVEDIPMTRD